MQNDIPNLALLSIAFLILFTLAEILFHKAKWKAEHSRKLVHIGTGLLTLLFPILLHNIWSVVFICGSFLVILLLSWKFNFLKSINQIDRKSVGSICYPIVVVICFCFYLNIQKQQSHCDYLSYPYTSFYLPILIMALGDPVAVLIGKRYQWKPYTFWNQTKSMGGSLAFFVVALILSISFLSTHHLLLCLIIAVLSTIVEACSRLGFDNLFIPISVIACLFFYY